MGGIYKNFHLSVRRVLMKLGELDSNFFLRSCIVPPSANRLHQVTSENADYIFEELSLYIYFFPS